MKLRKARRAISHFARSYPWQLALCMCLVTIIACACAFYLTPLRFLDPIDPPMHDVDPVALYSDMQAHPERYLVVDVRTAPVYEEGHVPGSINVPAHDLYDDRYVLPKHGKTIVLVCGDGKLAGVAYGYLEHYGFLNLERIAGGLSAWQADGLPVAK